MNFINLQVFWWIPAILVFMGLLFWRARVRRTNIMRLILGPRAKDAKHVQLSLARRLFRFLLLLFVMLMLIIAIARPTWKLQLIPYQSSGRDLMVLFDVSKSMLAQDIRPSRLAHAKLFLRDLVNQTGSDRFGLVAFAGRAFLECPMTTDKTSFIQYIDELDTESIPLGGTNLQLAIETAIKAFDAAEGNNRAIILITDGDELSGNSKLALAELKKTNIPLLIVGVGSSATPALIPIPQGKDKKSVKFMRDNKGELVKTRLNVTLMQQLADTSGGYFVHSTTTNFGLSQIEAGIKKLLPEELKKGEKTQPVERFYYFLAFATIILWLWMLISEHPGKKRKHNAKAAAVSVIFLLLNTADAQTKLTEPKAKKPTAAITNPVQAYNEARKIQKNGKKDSSKLYETAINLAGKNPTVRTNSFNNLGVKQHEKARQIVGQAIAQVKQQKLDAAISQLEGTKKILDIAEEMYIKALSTEIPESPDEDKKVAHESARNQSAINQQLLLNDRAKIDKLIKQIKELKKQQKKAQKQTKKAQDQQKKKNKQDKKKQDKKKQKKDNKQKQQQKQQDKKQQQKKDNKQKQQDKKQQQKKDNKQKQKQKQQQKASDELKKAQDDVNKLEKQAKELGQKKIEEQAKKAKKELKKAKEARKEKQGKKAEDHIKKALEQLKPKGSDKDKKKQDKKGKGKDKKDKKDKGDKDKKKDKGKGGKDKKLPKPQAAKQGEAKKAPKDIDPKEARKLLKLMTEKEKDFRKALKAHRKQQYKNIKVEKDW